MSNDAQKHLAVPRTERAHFARNFVTLAVCELRFPTLFEIEADRPPTSFVHDLRKQYPVHEIVKSVTVGPGAPRDHQAHSFKGRGGWSVTLRSSALTLETTSYQSFADFSERLSAVLAAAKKVIDSDFFTRVGLRYQNAIPYDQTTIAQWVNPALAGALGEGVFGTPLEHQGRVTGTTEEGGFTLGHGIGVNEKHKAAYIIDLDLFAEDVPVTDTLSLLGRLHQSEFDLFSWCLGPAAREHLGRNLIGGHR